jgi:hypothetical protein
MNHEDDLAARLVDIHEDFLDQRAHELRFDPCVGGGRVPRRAEIDSQSQQRLTVGR